jgi:hypothetical protein
MPQPMTNRTVLIAGASMVLAAATFVGAQRATVERHVSVRVTDGKNQPVKGLTPADFTVREDDIVREVLRVGPATPPSHIALLVDDTSEISPLLTDLRTSLRRFAFSLTALPTPPSLGVMTYAERPTMAVPFTTSDAALEGGIQRIFPRQGAGAYLFDAIIESSQALRKLKAERPAIVAFVMDGSPVFSNQRHTHVADALRDANASLWTIQLQRTGADDSAAQQERARVVGEVTTWSGGLNVPILSGQALERAFETVAGAMLGRYDVTYGRPEALIPPTRLAVESRNKALRVSAPRWPAP